MLSFTCDKSSETWKGLLANNYYYKSDASNIHFESYNLTRSDKGCEVLSFLIGPHLVEIVSGEYM